MADLSSFDFAHEKTLLSLSGLGVSLKLRSEQKQAVMTLLSRRDLLAILPTVFGKSLIFQLLVRVKEILSSKPSCVIVVCGCYCLIQEQVLRASGWHWTLHASFRMRGFSPVVWFARLAEFSE